MMLWIFNIPGRNIGRKLWTVVIWQTPSGNQDLLTLGHKDREAERDCSSGLLPFLLSDRSDAHLMRGQERGSVTPVTLFTYFPSGSRLPPVVLAVGSATEFVTDRYVLHSLNCSSPSSWILLNFRVYIKMKHLFLVQQQTAAIWWLL